jgi:hypothetical protein
MPRKTRKHLVDIDEEQTQVEREAFYRRLERELHAAWQLENSACSSGVSSEVRAYPSAL